LAQLYSRLANVGMLLAILSSVDGEPHEQVVVVTLCSRCGNKYSRLVEVICAYICTSSCI